MISHNYFDGKKFPHTESDKFEFKESICSKSFDKYIQTICGFLNTSGGNLIFGIKDNLELKGLNQIKQKELDNFILRLDSIINEKQIVGIKYNGLDNGINNLIDDECEINLNQLIYLKSSNIKINQVKTNSGKIFLWIEVIPEDDVKYQLANGMVYHRLGASNYFEKTERMYKQTDFESACKQIQKNAELENKSNIVLFQKTIKEKNKHIELLNIKIQEIQENNKMYKKHTSNTINKKSINDDIENQTDLSNLTNQTNQYNQTNQSDLSDLSDLSNTNQTDLTILTNSNQIISYNYNKFIWDIISNVFFCFR